MSINLSRFKVNVNGDLSPIVQYLDINAGIAEVMSSGRKMDPYTVALALNAASHFDAHAAVISGANKTSLGHVYEWGQIGKIEGQLWRTMLVGAPGNRVLDYKWIASRTLVPAGEDNTGIQGDTRKQIHTFRWKAPITELGIVTKINPAGSRYLAFPVGPGYGGAKNKEGTIGFAQGEMSVRPDKKMVGSFTALWLEYFSVNAVKMVTDEEPPKIKKFFSEEIERKLYGMIDTSTPHPARQTFSVNLKPKKKMKITAEEAVKRMNLSRLTQARSRRRFYDANSAGGGEGE